VLTNEITQSICNKDGKVNKIEVFVN